MNKYVCLIVKKILYFCALFFEYLDITFINFNLLHKTEKSLFLRKNMNISYFFISKNPFVISKEHFSELFLCFYKILALGM